MGICETDWFNMDGGGCVSFIIVVTALWSLRRRGPIQG